MNQIAQPAQDVDRNNTLGLAGFIISVLGLVGTGGLLSPVGLVISLIAMGRQPRGFAIAGVVIGLIGSCGIIAILVLGLGGAILVMLGLAAIALSHTEQTQLTVDMVHTAIAIKEYEEQNGVLPATLATLGLPQSRLVDPWGNRYEYHFTEEEPGFDLISSGADGDWESEDDIYLSQIGKAWETGGMTIHASANDGTGRSTLTIGDVTFEVTEDGDGGSVIMRHGDDRVIVIEGDDEGGHVSIGRDATESAEEATTSSNESSTTAEGESDPDSE